MAITVVYVICHTEKDVYMYMTGFFMYIHMKKPVMVGLYMCTCGTEQRHVKACGQDTSFKTLKCPEHLLMWLQVLSATFVYTCTCMQEVQVQTCSLCHGLLGNSNVK